MGLSLEEIAEKFGEKVEVTLDNAMALQEAETGSESNKGGVREIEDVI